MRKLETRRSIAFDLFQVISRLEQSRRRFDMRVNIMKSDGDKRVQ
jgi:hypothetical protein